MPRTYNPGAKRESNARYRTAVREWMKKLKDASCKDCGGRFHHSAMHWDHLPSFKKVMNLARLMTQVDRATMLAEIEKCELVCANCHAVRTWQRAQTRKHHSFT